MPEVWFSKCCSGISFPLGKSTMYFDKGSCRQSLSCSISIKIATLVNCLVVEANCNTFPGFICTFNSQLAIPNAFLKIKYPIKRNRPSMAKGIASSDETVLWFGWCIKLLSIFSCAIEKREAETVMSVKRIL